MRIFKLLTICISLIVLCLSLAGCGFLFGTFPRTDFELLQEISEIKAIEIVTIGEIERIENVSQNSSVLSKPSFDIICNVEDIEQFMEDFYKVECYSASPPSSPKVGSIGIKITYENEEYDIICSSGQAEYRDGIYYRDSGKNSFDEKQFDELINQYVNNTNKDS